MKDIFFLFSAIVGLFVSLHSGQAAPSGGACVHNAAPAGAIGKRVAVIVGNGAYANGIPALPNPTHDAEATSKALGALGFEIYLSTNADSAALQTCLDQAYAGLANTDVAMLYYSGHGIQIRDENYLVATDAGTGDLKRGFVPVQPIVDALQKQAKATLVVLDACRNNPMVTGGQAQAGLSTSTGRGLARVKDPAVAKAAVAGTPGVMQARGLMVAYATSPNAVAQDGTGQLSPFTGAFVKLVGTSGYSIQHVMSDVNRSVGEATEWAQTPWMKSSLTGELKLGGGETLAQAQSISDNHAARAQNLLDTDGKKEPAIIEALKGLPASPDEGTLKRFPKAYSALYNAVQGGETILPLTPGMTEVAVSKRDRVAVFKRSADFRSGTFELWSPSEQKVVTTLDSGRGGASEKFTFSSHGKLLAAALGNTTAVYDGIDGHKMFELRGRPSSIAFSPDESRLMLEDHNGGRLTIIDLATQKPITTIKQTQLDSSAPRKRGSVYLSKVIFGSNDTICFSLSLGNRQSLIGVFDLKQNKTTHQREVGETVSAMLCDPVGKYMVRTAAVGGDDKGMEIWDLSNDTIKTVKAPIIYLSGIDPEGKYVSAHSFSNETQGFYDLATAKRGYPPTVPDGYWILGARVRNTSGGLVSQDTNENPWRDWPDETLFGPALVKHALASLTSAQRAEVDRDRITYTMIAGNP